MWEMGLSELSRADAELETQPTFRNLQAYTDMQSGWWGDMKGPQQKGVVTYSAYAETGTEPALTLIYLLCSLLLHSRRNQPPSTVVSDLFRDSVTLLQLRSNTSPASTLDTLHPV